MLECVRRQYKQTNTQRASGGPYLGLQVHKRGQPHLQQPSQRRDVLVRGPTGHHRRHQRHCLRRDGGGAEVSGAVAHGLPRPQQPGTPRIGQRRSERLRRLGRRRGLGRLNCSPHCGIDWTSTAGRAGGAGLVQGSETDSLCIVPPSDC